MESDWVRFFELVERLQPVSPELVQLALRYGHGKNKEVLEEVEREFWRRSAGQGQQEPFFDHSNHVNLPRCMEFLGDLRKQEDHLRQMQVKATQDLLRVEAARRAFMETLKEMLRAEQRSNLSSDQWVELRSTPEEIAEGLQELKEQGGSELHEFIGELEQVLNDRERIRT